MFDFIKKLFNFGSTGTGIIGPDPHDSRDFKYKPEKTAYNTASVSISRDFSLRPMSCPILNQQQTGSCTGHAAAAACNVLMSKILGKSKNYKINPFYIYYYARFMDGMHLVDGGAYMRSLMKALKEYGFCSCTLCSPSETPPEDFDGKTFKIKDYKRIENSIEDVQYAIQIDRLPVVISFKVCWDKINKNNGIIKYSNDVIWSSDGYHAVAVLGWKYINDQLYFVIQNSWGSLSGDDGYYYLDARYITDYKTCPDIWTFSADYSF